MAAIIGAYAYYGGFKTLTVEITKQKSEVIAYEDMTGDYSQTPVVSDRVYNSLLNDFKTETFRGIGIFYDNPQTTEVSKLRSEIGCILENPDSTLLTSVESKFKIKAIPEGDYITIEFPYKGMMSIMVGIMKVYPALNDYIKQNGYSYKSPVIEIYDVPNEKIIYMIKANKE